MFLSLVTAALYEKNMTQNLDAFNKKFSNLATAQIYKRIEKHVIAEDIISLNLLVTQLIEEDGIAFVEVSLGKEKIIEVGKKSGTDSTYFYEVIFDDSKEGSVTIGLKGFESLSDSLAGQIFLVLSVYAIFIWFFSSSMMIWINSEGGSSSNRQENKENIKETCFFL